MKPHSGSPVAAVGSCSNFSLFSPSRALGLCFPASKSQLLINHSLDLCQSPQQRLPEEFRQQNVPGKMGICCGSFRLSLFLSNTSVLQNRTSLVTVLSRGDLM